MTVLTHTLERGTRGNDHILDLTPDLQALVDESGIGVGQLTAMVVGSTAALTTVEFEPGLVNHDIAAALERIAPRSGAYEHEKTWHDDNGHSHVRASLIGPSLALPIVDGSLPLGTWQQVVLVDLDTRPITTMACKGFLGAGAPSGRRPRAKEALRLGAPCSARPCSPERITRDLDDAQDGVTPVESHDVAAIGLGSQTEQDTRPCTGFTLDDQDARSVRILTREAAHPHGPYVFQIHVRAPEEGRGHPRNRPAGAPGELTEALLLREKGQGPLHHARGTPVDSLDLDHRQMIGSRSTLRVERM
jgi:secondary thiamine-phosphate synthase enzyme